MPERSLPRFFLQTKNFFGIRRINKANKNLYTYQIFPYKTSNRVMDIIFKNKNIEQTYFVVATNDKEYPDQIKDIRLIDYESNEKLVTTQKIFHYNIDEIVKHIDDVNEGLPQLSW